MGLLKTFKKGYRRTFEGKSLELQAEEEKAEVEDMKQYLNDLKEINNDG